MDISPMCAVELLEIIKYLDDELKKNIPQDFEIYLNSIKDNNYQKVTALMLTADPFHRLHERLVRMTIDKADNINKNNGIEILSSIYLSPSIKCTFLK